MSQCDRCSTPIELNMLELFSGIGGMHSALQTSLAPELYSKVNVTAIDINTNANLVYSYNFPDNRLLARNITALKLNEISKRPIDLVTMSPPCQPFTRLGLKKDLDDMRSDAFYHLITNVWPNWEIKPPMFLLENVKGFEVSKAHDLLLEVLTNCGYDVREFLLSPHQFGIPNTRLRYYLLAKIPLRSRQGLSSSSKAFVIPETKEIITDTSQINWKDEICARCKNVLLSNLDDKISRQPGLISEYLETNSSDEEKNNPILVKYNVPRNIIDKYLPAMDIVSRESRKSCCFTRSYGTLITGSGSLLNTSSTENHFTKNISTDEINLRYFTPREVANLMCFPDTFRFPSNVTDKQCYKLLGNSINVQVVSFLFKILFSEPSRS